jgi:hypothetical protein
MVGLSPKRTAIMKKPLPIKSNNRLLIAATLNLIAALVRLLDHLGRVW